MRRRYRVVLVIAIAAAAWIAITRTTTTGKAFPPERPASQHVAVDAFSQPPATLTLRDTYVGLWGQAAMGDKTAASRLFSEEATCLTVGSLRRRLPEDTYQTWLSVHQAWLMSRSAEDQIAIKQRAEAKYETLAANAALCANLDPSFDDGRVYDSALLAAKGGDDMATACLIEAPWAFRPMSNDEASAFDETRLALAEQAMRHGSWTAVSALRDLYSSTGRSNQIPGHVHMSRYDELRMRYLEQLGRQQSGVVDAAADHAVEVGEIDVMPTDVARASAWARQMFTDSFSRGGPPLSTSEDACTGPLAAR